MRHLMTRFALAAACGALIASPAAAQTVSEISVTAHKGPTGTLSYKVGYADLNLQEAAGRKALRQRISTTARYLCRKLGETDRASYNSCRDRAVADARPQARAAVKAAMTRTGPWSPGPAWTAPGR